MNNIPWIEQDGNEWQECPHCNGLGITDSNDDCIRCGGNGEGWFPIEIDDAEPATATGGSELVEPNK